MSKEYVTHWILGVTCAVIWFWGDRLSIPKDAQVLAASIVPGLLGSALSIQKGQLPSLPSAPASAPLTESQPEQPQ